MAWGANVKKLDVGIPDTLVHACAGVQINQLELTAAVTAARPGRRPGRLLPADARSGRALARGGRRPRGGAVSIGIPLKTIWVVVWSVAGMVAIVAGIMWGAKSGVQFSLLADRAQGAAGPHPGRLHLGARRHRRRPHHRRRREARRGVLGPARRRRHRELVRLRAWPSPSSCCPSARPLRREDHRASRRRDLPGSRAVQDAATPATRRSFPILQDRIFVVARRSLAAFLRAAARANEYWLQAVLIPFLIYALAALGLNLLTGLRRAALARHRRLHGRRARTRPSSSPPAFPASTSSSSSCSSGLVAARSWASCSACPASGSRASTWRWRRWPRSSS